VNDPDKQLLLAMNRGHQAAAEALWGRFSPRLVAYARVLLKGDEAAASDAVQGVFLRILSCDRALILGVREVLPWLIGLTRHGVIDILRSRRRNKARLVRVAIERRQSLRIAQVNESDDEASSDPRLAAVLSALSLLPRRSAEIITLRHSAGLTFDQIGLALQCNAGSVASRYRRAINTLRTLLKDTDPSRCSHTLVEIPNDA
jgi:RNA polymerase sigma factor (sigma-70 family)